MVEYASVRSSLYDIDSLVSQLNERSGDGWEVVQILPTGGDVTAVLRRSDEPVAEAGSDDTAGASNAVHPGGLVPRSGGPVRAALLGRQRLVRAHGAPGPDVHRPARRLT